ncbi:MAG: glycosyltransferase family 4 protein [Fibrobacter sp.]|nr:glycosyltransferase family 4 protein [Fibrobacter sp.]
MEKKKIIFINHWARFTGGAEISLLDILKYSAEKADVLLVCSEDGTLVSKVRQSGIRTRIINCPDTVSVFRRNNLLKMIITAPVPLAAFLKFMISVYRVIKKEKPDIIHANVPKSHVTLCFLRMLGINRKAVFHIREIYKSGSMPYLLYNMIFPFKNFSIIAISEAVKKSLPERLQKHVSVIYNGVEIRSLKEHVPADRIKFLYLGRIVPWKGCHMLIQAFNILFKRYGDAAGTLDIRGGTFYWNELYKHELERSVNELQLGHVIRILPFTEDSYGELCTHDVLCMASFDEPFGRVAAEAQAAGLPVIGFESGGMAEVVLDKKSGFLVKQNDIDGLANAMEMFVKDKCLVTSMGTCGYNLASEKFNNDFQISKIFDFMML